jgi:MinD-like ATPase involved in chromosome partitioning or flagellar assembly
MQFVPSWGHAPMACVIAVAGAQPQAGKTTIAVNLAASLIRLGYACILLDLAPTADASRSLGVNLRSQSPSICGVLTGKSTLRQAALPTASGIDLVAGHADVTTLASGVDQAHRRLQAELAAAREVFPYVVLDCPSLTSPLEATAFTAADHILILHSPGQPFGQSMEALSELQVAYVAGRLGVVINKVLPELADAPGDGRAAWGLAARVLATVGYVPGLAELYWHGVPPALQHPDEVFSETLLGLAGGLERDCHEADRRRER